MRNRSAVSSAGAAAEAAESTPGVDFIGGLAAVVLGILAIFGISSATLSLVGLLTFGAGLLSSGSQVAARTFATR